MTGARTAAAVVLLAALASCGDLPQPFAGNPGRTARRLAQPPPARLLVEPAAGALLSDVATKGFAIALAAALVDREVPAVAAFGQPGDWRLVTTAELERGQVMPKYQVQDPQGATKGAVQGAPVPAAEWQRAGADTLRREAALAAPDISALLDRIEAARQESDPNSLLNRPTRVALKGVFGAPGDGNVSLARQFRDSIAKRGEELQDRLEDADFVVECQVKSVPEGGGVSRIELQWIVSDAQRRETGRVVQINEVQDHDVAGLWGDIAIAAASEAAGGVRDVILNRLSGRVGAKPPPPAS